MIHRLQQAMVVGRLARFPAVAIVGPRQAGKTTLAKEILGRMDIEDHSAVGGLWFPMTLPDALDR